MLEACYNRLIKSEAKALFYKYKKDFSVIALSIIGVHEKKIFNQINGLDKEDQTKLIKNIVKYNP